MCSRFEKPFARLKFADYKADKNRVVEAAKSGSIGQTKARRTFPLH